jgi:nucleoside-diphosphate-sugar epimerase
MRLLVLGASGFLGGHVARAAETDPGFEVIRHVRQGDSSREVVLDLASASSDQVREMFERVTPDVVVNAVGTTGAESETLAVLNVRVVELLVATLARAAPETRFIGIGSSAEYGPSADRNGIDEMTPARPVSDYGRSKLAATQRVLEAVGSGELDAVVLRIFNPIGAGMPATTLAGSAVKQLRSAIAAGEQSIRLGPLDDYRDFVDARDVADAVLIAAPVKGIDPPILNVGSGVAVRNRELIRQLAAIAGFRGSVLEEAPRPERSQAVRWQRAKISRMRAIGWEPRRTLSQALASLWAGEAGG